MNRPAILGCALLLAGCATGYHATGFSGGFSEDQLGENVFQVSFRGNGHTSSERAADLALLRSAEVSAEHGFPFFAIVDGVSDTRTSGYTTPTTTTGSATVIGNTVSGSSTTTGGQTYTIRKPSTKNTIVCYKDKPNSVAFEATYVIASIRQKYGIEAR
jgi:hypothetical protein